MAGLLGIIIFFVIFVLYFAMILGVYAVQIVTYVLTSLSYQRIGSRLGIKKAWLAWIPVASSYVLGAVTDKIETENGEYDKKWRRILPILLCIGTGGVILWAIGYYVLYFITILVPSLEIYETSPILAIAMVLWILVYVVILSFSMLSGILNYICTFKVFEYILPDKAVKYLLLTLIVPLGAPLCIHRAAKALEAQTDGECNETSEASAASADDTTADTP